MRRRPFERAHAQMARRNACEHGPGQHALTLHGLARGHDGEAARRGNAEGVHRLTDDELAQHRTKRGAAVATPRIRRLSGALELHVHARAIGRHLLTEQDGAAIAEAREVPELMAGIGLRERTRPLG